MAVAPPGDEPQSARIAGQHAQTREQPAEGIARDDHGHDAGEENRPVGEHGVQDGGA